MTNQVVPLIRVYAVVGVATAIIEIICVALVSAYVSQISRRHRQDRIDHVGREFNTGYNLKKDNNIMPEIPDFHSVLNESDV